MEETRAENLDCPNTWPVAQAAEGSAVPGAKHVPTHEPNNDLSAARRTETPRRASPGVLRGLTNWSLGNVSTVDKNAPL